MALKKTEAAKRKTAAIKAAAKGKVAAKISAKTVRRTSKRLTVAGACALFAVLFAGCASQPNRALTQTFDGCTFTVIVGAPDCQTNGTSSADAGVPSVELFTQAMSVENSGTESNAPSQTVSPDLDVSVPVNKAGTAQSVGSVLGDAVASLCNSLASKAASDASASASCTNNACSEDE